MTDERLAKIKERATGNYDFCAATQSDVLWLVSQVESFAAERTAREAAEKERDELRAALSEARKMIAELEAEEHERLYGKPKEQR